MKVSSEHSLTYSLQNYTILIIRIILALVFIFSGVTKLFEMQGFIQIIHRFEILPEIIEPYFASILTIIELFLGMCLLAGLFLKWTIKFLIILVSVFIFVITITMFR